MILTKEVIIIKIEGANAKTVKMNMTLMTVAILSGSEVSPKEKVTVGMGTEFWAHKSTEKLNTPKKTKSPNNPEKTRDPEKRNNFFDSKSRALSSKGVPLEGAKLVSR
jgi:hypothetical protein